MVNKLADKKRYPTERIKNEITQFRKNVNEVVGFAETKLAIIIVRLDYLCTYFHCKMVNWLGSKMLLIENLKK
jgi:hypothetical protein